MWIQIAAIAADLIAWLQLLALQTATSPRPNPNCCGSGCCTSPPDSPEAAANAGSASPTTGRGPPRSLPRSPRSWPSPHPPDPAADPAATTRTLGDPHRSATRHTTTPNGQSDPTAHRTRSTTARSMPHERPGLSVRSGGCADTWPPVLVAQWLARPSGYLTPSVVAWTRRWPSPRSRRTVPVQPRHRTPAFCGHTRRTPPRSCTSRTTPGLLQPVLERTGGRIGKITDYAVKRLASFKPIDDQLS